jgi:hypothetical protein
MGTKITFYISFMIYFNQPLADLVIYFLNESDKSQLTFQPAKNDSGKTTLTKIFFTTFSPVSDIEL